MYEIIYGTRAEKDILNIRQKKILKNIIKKIENLSKNPRPPKVKKLVGIEGWRIQVGKWRVLYQIDDNNKKVLIYRIKQRKEIYRR